MNDRHMLHVFAKYTLMSVGGMLANSCYILADTFFVAQGLGTQGLAALNLAIPVYNFVYGAGLLLGMGGATRYAVCKSRGDARGADEAFGYALGMAAVCSAVGMLLGAFASGRLTALLGASGDVAGMTQTYLQVMLLFSPAFIFNGVLVCFVRNDGNPRLAMLSTVIGSFSNIVLDYVFIFPLGMGMFGAIFATGLSPVLGILVLLPHWFSPRRGFHARRLHPNAGVAGTIVWLGLPAYLAQLSSGVVMITFNSIILRLEGSTGVAAYGVVANISLVAAAIYTGLGQGMQPLASRAWGRGQTAGGAPPFALGHGGCAWRFGCAVFGAVCVCPACGTGFQQRKRCGAAAHCGAGPAPVFCRRRVYGGKHRVLHLFPGGRARAARAGAFAVARLCAAGAAGLRHGGRVGHDGRVAYGACGRGRVHGAGLCAVCAQQAQAARAAKITFGREELRFPLSSARKKQGPPRRGGPCFTENRQKRPSHRPGTQPPV